QMHERMQAMTRMGKNKHEAKQQAPDGKPEGIFSKTTYDNYKHVTLQTFAWLKAYDRDIQDNDDALSHDSIDYLQKTRNEATNQNALRRDLGAVNKLFNTTITKKEAHLARRSYKKITRSRSEKAYNKNYNPKNYEKQIVVAKAFGLRRKSFVTGDYRLKEGSIYQHNNTVYAAVVEKGGKFRNV